MKKILLTLVFCIAAVGTSFAQNNVQAMRFLTINALMEYGQKLYDRGNYNEASAVFKHVLAYDGKQPQALKYLKKMEDSSRASVPPALSLQVSPIALPPTSIDISDTKELKKAIEAEKQVIKVLQDQIMRMRSDLDSQSSGERINKENYE